MVKENKLNSCDKCSNKLNNILFPKMENKSIGIKIFVYACSLLHIIGVLFIIFGIIGPPKFLKIYLVYLILISISYIFFEGYCFLTLLPNKYSGLIETPLTITLEKARKILVFYIIITILSILYPEYSLYFLIKRYFCNC